MYNMKKADKTPDEVVVYIQNSGEFVGDHFFSTILFCNVDPIDVKSTLNSINESIYFRYMDYPVDFHGIMENKLMKYEGLKEEKLGDFIRNNCIVADRVSIDGGDIYGGKSGKRFVEYPEINEKHFPIISRKDEKNVIMNMCSFSEGHNTCNLYDTKSSISELRKLQSKLKKLFVKKQLKKWENKEGDKEKEIYELLKKIID